MKQKCILILFAVFSLLHAQAQINITNPRCELLVNPLGIDVTAPRLSWEIVAQPGMRNVQQLAYHILAASSKEKLSRDEADLWNSGKQNSSQSIHINYAGKKLNSKMPVYWKVKVFTNKGETSWSETAWWSMGLLNKTDWKAKWIGYDRASPWDSITQFSRLSARYLRKPFQLETGIKRATAYVSGLGLYQLYINGKKTSDDVLTPLPTDYRKSVLYNTYDVTQQLRTGSNVVGVVLGNGR
ncbi:MAG: alpha-L-rhamnosidase N-terminal domain-containing protein, partial [Chitinophagaceae bacterium]